MVDKGAAHSMTRMGLMATLAQGREERIENREWRIENGEWRVEDVD